MVMAVTTVTTVSTVTPTTATVAASAGGERVNGESGRKNQHYRKAPTP